MKSLNDYIQKERKRQDFIIENLESDLAEEKKKSVVAEQAGLLLENRISELQNEILGIGTRCESALSNTRTNSNNNNNEFT